MIFLVSWFFQRFNVFYFLGMWEFLIICLFYFMLECMGLVGLISLIFFLLLLVQDFVVLILCWMRNIFKRFVGFLSYSLRGIGYILIGFLKFNLEIFIVCLWSLIISMRQGVWQCFFIFLVRLGRVLFVVFFFVFGLILEIQWFYFLDYVICFFYLRFFRILNK